MRVHPYFNCSYLRIKNKVKKARDVKGHIIFRKRGKYYNKVKYYNYELTKDSIFVPFFYKKVSVRKFTRLKAMALFLNGASAVIPIVKKLNIGQIFFNRLENNYNTIEGFSYGKKVSWIYDSGKKYAVARGSYCKIIYNVWDSYILTLPSGLLKFFNKNTICMRDSLVYVKSFCLKRGAKLLRWKGLRPVVRGIAKNPNDHPHGGRTKSVLRPMTPWGKNIKKSKS